MDREIVEELGYPAHVQDQLDYLDSLIELYYVKRAEKAKDLLIDAFKSFPDVQALSLYAFYKEHRLSGQSYEDFMATPVVVFGEEPFYSLGDFNGAMRLTIKPANITGFTGHGRVIAYYIPAVMTLTENFNHVTKEFLMRRLKGGVGSGNFGHAGRIGKVGGSAPDGVTADDAGHFGMVRPGGVVVKPNEPVKASLPDANKIHPDVEKVSVKKNFVAVTEDEARAFVKNKLSEKDKKGNVKPVSKFDEESMVAILQTMPRAVLKSNIRSVVIMDNEKEFEAYYRKQVGKSGKNALAVDFHNLVTGTNEIVFKPFGQTRRQTSLHGETLQMVIAHEFGHAVYYASTKNNAWNSAYRNHNFDRHTLYSMASKKEGFSETFASYCANGGIVSDASFGGAKMRESYRILEQVINASSLKEFIVGRLKGGVGSGNFGHAGRIGKVGGSSDSGSSLGTNYQGSIDYQDITGQSLWILNDGEVLSSVGGDHIGLASEIDKYPEDLDARGIIGFYKGNPIVGVYDVYNYWERAEFNHVLKQVEKNYDKIIKTFDGIVDKNTVSLLVSSSAGFSFHPLQEADIKERLKGGAGSGNFGHAGRPGEVGGSSSDGASLGSRTTTEIHAEFQRYFPNITLSRADEAKYVKNKQKLIDIRKEYLALRDGKDMEALDESTRLNNAYRKANDEAAIAISNLKTGEEPSEELKNLVKKTDNLYREWQDAKDKADRVFGRKDELELLLRNGAPEIVNPLMEIGRKASISAREQINDIAYIKPEEIKSMVKDLSDKLIKADAIPDKTSVEYEKTIRDIDSMRLQLLRNSAGVNSTRKQVDDILNQATGEKLPDIKLNGGIAIEPYANGEMPNDVARDKLSGLIGRNPFLVDDMPKALYFENTRAHYEAVFNEIILGDKSPSTAIHELGHALEEKDFVVKKLALEFLGKRIKGLQAVEISKLEAGRFNDDEIAVKDSFFHAYAGKIYNSTKKPDGSYDLSYATTEIVSMGLQGMNESPLWFSRNDPDYFDFMYALTRIAS